MKNFFARAKNFFREDVSEVVGGYFDGEKIFVVRLAEKIETAAVRAEAADFERVAEKISLVCRQRGWKTSAVGFCLRDEDAVTYLAEVENLPAKEIPAFVGSWSLAQAGKDAASAFVPVGGGLWMETLPRTTFDEICAAFDKFKLKLRALSLMPPDLLAKAEPFHRAEFIAQIVRNKKSPNFLARGSSIDWRRISAAVAAFFFIAAAFVGANLFIDYRAAADELDAAKISVDERKEDFALKKSLDADVAELRRLNKLIAAQNITPKKFNLLLNLGRVAGGGVRLTKIRVEENFFELEGTSKTPDAVRSFLARVKNSVMQSARLESSAERDDGQISFTIRAAI